MTGPVFYSAADLDSCRMARHLLPPPGNEVVGHLLAVISTARIVVLANPAEAYAFLGGDWTLLADGIKSTISEEAKRLSGRVDR